MKIRILPIIVFFHIMLIGVKISLVKVDAPYPHKEIVANISTGEVLASETNHEQNANSNVEASSEHSNKKTDPAKSELRVSNIPPKETPLLNKNCGEYNLELLQSLAERREEIEKWLNEAENRQEVLKNTENRLNAKLADLTSLKNDVKNLLDIYNEKENEKVKNLVKIYENMKPQDAATIFEQLDIPVLLQVINNMKETKVAPILAKMNPMRAKEITTQFAQQKRLIGPYDDNTN